MKKTKHYTINVDEEVAKKIETIAQLSKRKNADVLRIIIEEKIDAYFYNTIDLGGSLIPQGEPHNATIKSDN